MKRFLLTILLIAFSHSIVHAKFAGGSGEKDDPWQVASVNQLQEIKNHPDKHFIQIHNIDASDTKDWNHGLGFDPLGTLLNPFKGTYDGAGYSISELTISYKPGCTAHVAVGLFGQISGAQIKNTKLVNADISRLGDFVGGLVGENRGEILNSCVTGHVLGKYSVGGLVGKNAGKIRNSCSGADVSGSKNYVGGLAGDNSGEITNSFATGHVSGTENYVGGLTGDNSGEITNSFAKGHVSGSIDVGGLVGWNRGRISNTYALGNVSGDVRVGGLAGSNNSDTGIVTSYYANGQITGREDIGGLVGWNNATMENNYWDREVTQQSDGIGRGNPDGATGLTTSQMTGESAFENMSAFDFDKTWLLTEGYPALYWEDVDVSEPPTTTEHKEHPVTFKLHQNYPNPFNPSTQISYSVSEQTHVRLEVYNALGQQVGTLVDKTKNAGRYEVTFDATGLSSGIYLYRLQTESHTGSRQMLLVK